MKGGEGRYKFVQTPLCPYLHKSLRRLALEKDKTLAEVLKEAIKLYLIEQGGIKPCQKMK